jgi:hypothetical protein
MKLPLSGGVVTTSTSLGVGQSRESVRNPLKLSEQTAIMRTGLLKKIKKASPKTNEQWHAEITRDSQALDKAIDKLQHAVANIDQKPFATPTGKWKHRLATVANAVFSVPDAGNAKRNRNTVLALSKKRQLPDSRTSLAKATGSVKTAASKLKKLVTEEEGPAPREAGLQAARRESTAAFRQAMEASQLAMNAKLAENEARALYKDLQSALTNKKDADAKLQALTQGRDLSALEQEVHQSRNTVQEARAHLDKCEASVAALSKSKVQARERWNASLTNESESVDQSVEQLMLLADLDSKLEEAVSELAKAKEDCLKADDDLATAEKTCKDAQNWSTIQKADTENIDAAIRKVQKIIDDASKQATELAKKRDETLFNLKHAELREMQDLAQELPGFSLVNSGTMPLRSELMKLAHRLGQREIDVTKPRIPSPIVLNVVIGTLDQVIEPRRENETEADAATRRQNEAAQILREFTLNLPPGSSDAHLRWQAAVKSLPGGLRVMEQFGFPPSDEEATVVFAKQIADEQPALAYIANQVAQTGRTDVLKDADKALYDAALVDLLKGHNLQDLKQELVTRNIARRVFVRAEKSLQEGVPGADRDALIAARRAAEKILETGRINAAAKDDLKHYNALRKEQDAVRRTASYVGAVARNLLTGDDPRVDKELMERAALAADHIHDNGHDFDLSESMRACFYAVRNGFLSPSDPNLQFAEERFEKLKDTWVERADLAAAQEKFDRPAVLRKAHPDDPNRPVDRAGRMALTRQGVQQVSKTREELEQEYGGRLRKGWGGLYIPDTLRKKTPFTPGALREASKISTLGYADPARPMQRLDKVSGRILKHLDKCVSTIPAQSLSADQAVMLAATLVAGEKVRADAKRRPDHVELDPEDAGRIEELFNRRIRPLVDPLELYPTEKKIRDGIAQLLNGDVRPTPAAAHSLVDLVNELNIPATLQDGSDNVHRRDLMKDAGIASDMISTAAVSEIHTVVDLYNYLKPMIQQLELRGKVKSSSGGSAGVSTRLLSFPLELVLHMTGLPRGALGGSRVRHAVFEIGFSTTGFEIFIGSEKRTGAFATGGYGFREEVAQVLGFGAAVDKTLSVDSSTIPGVWLKFPRGDGDEVVRDRALAGLQTLLGVKDQDGNVSVVESDRDGESAALPANAPAAKKNSSSEGATLIAKESQSEDSATRDVNIPIIPGKLGKLLANNPNMSVSIVGDYQETNFKNELAGSANLLSFKLASEKDMPRITALQAGASTAFRTKRFELSDATGYMRLTRSNKFNGGIAFAQGVIGGVSDSFATDHPHKTSTAYGSALAQGRQIHERGVDTKYRGISRDGEINAVDTRLDTENVNLNNHLARIEANRRAWIQCGINELFKDPKDATPMCEKIRIAEAWLDDHIAAVKEVANGNARHVYSLSYSLKPPAGAILDGLNADAEMRKRLLEAGKGKDARDAYMQDIAQMDEVMLDQSSWREWKITASERTSEKKSKGWVLGLEYTRRNVGEGQRGFNSYPK